MTSTHDRLIANYFMALYLAVGLVLSRNLYINYDQAGESHPLGLIYALVALLSYAYLYVVPGLLIVKLVDWLLSRIASRKVETVTFNALLMIIGWWTLLIIYADSELFALYNYHFDGFVWNLLTTPGGIDSLGATYETKLSFALIAIAFLGLSAAIFWLVIKSAEWSYIQTYLPRFSFKVWFISLFFTFLAEESFYGISKLYRKHEYIQASVAFPFFLDTSFRSFAKSFGMQVESQELQEMRISTGKLNYPMHPIAVEKPDKPMNIVWLVAESLRADMLSPHVMPHLSAFAEHSLRFNDHYSGGNRTRMGLLSMFYGLYAPYWHEVLKQKTSPVLMDVLLAQNYQMSVHTSQSFTYPELSDTVFSHVPRERMHELNQGSQAWRNDTQNISDILQFIGERKKDQPFFTFMFFESTHAPYNFPDESIINPDFAPTINYASMDLKHNAERIKNRYINSAHFIDSQVARVTDYLKSNGLMENTIFLFTGDHGEEFMEKGHWGHGHNALFPEEQIRVPLVLSIPGMEARQVDYMTSHLDIPATILSHLGVKSRAEDYSLGHDMLASDFSRAYTVIGNDDYITYLDDHYKITFPFKRHAERIAVRAKNDSLVQSRESSQLLKDYQPALVHIIGEANQFTN